MNQKEGLTAKQVQHAKAGEKQVEIPAGGGLYLVVRTNGKKSWRFRYRYRGRTRGLMFEKGYPELSLAGARAEAESKIEELANGIDPAAAQAAEIEQTTPNSIKAVVEEWLKRHVMVHTSERTQAEFARIMRKEVLPHWKDKFIGEISKPDVLRVLDSLSDRGTPALANKTLGVMKSFFSWTVEERGYRDFSPAHKLKPPAKNVSRERVLDESELAEVWSAIAGLGYPVAPFAQCLILLSQRRGEVSGMRWRDVDLKEGLWTIPAELMKSGRLHLVPLSDPVVEILKAQPRFKYIDDKGKERDGEYVFTTTSGRLPINGFSKLKERIDKAIGKARETAGIETPIASWTLHDLRRTATTMMAESGVLPHVLSAVLGHSAAASVSVMPSAAVTRVYNRYAYLEEKRAALHAWADYVVSLETSKKAKATA